jgi:hypothetical protein
VWEVPPTDEENAMDELQHVTMYMRFRYSPGTGALYVWTDTVPQSLALVTDPAPPERFEDPEVARLNLHVRSEIEVLRQLAVAEDQRRHSVSVQLGQDELF